MAVLPFDLATEEGMLAYTLEKLPSLGFSSVTKVERLPEGYGNFVYRIQVQDDHRPSSPSTVIAKYYAPYGARAQTWELEQTRLDYEVAMLSLLTKELHQVLPSDVRPPQILHYDASNYVLFMEDVGTLPSVKDWLQPNVSMDVAAQIGTKLGVFLATLHNETAGRRDLFARFSGNTTGKYVSGTLYYRGLPTEAEKYGYKGEHYEAAASAGAHEVDNLAEVLTIGDFWTGNVLVDQSKDLQLRVLDFELSKPGTAEYDVGQLSAEVYFLAALRDAEKGTAMLNAFLNAYVEHRNVRVNAFRVATRIASQIFVIAPRAWHTQGSPEKIQEMLKMGDEMLRCAWKEDLEGLKKFMVRPLIQ